MNCKPGDLAQCLPTPEIPENLGAFVHVEEAYSGQPGCWIVTTLSTMRCMRLSTGEIKTVPPGTRVVAPDHLLRPYRPGDDADETLQWAGKPEECPF